MYVYTNELEFQKMIDANENAMCQSRKYEGDGK